MSFIKDLTISVNKKPTTITVILYNGSDSDYTVPFESNCGQSLDNEEREYIRDKVEAKIRTLNVKDEPYSDYSDDIEDEELD